MLGPSMGPRFRHTDRDTAMLLPPDLRDWVDEDDLVHFVIAAVERLPLSHLHVNHKGTGDAQYSPYMMLALLIYSYANGVVSSRRIERSTYRDIAVRYLTGNTHPDHDTISAFRRKNLEALAPAFVEVLELARELKLLRLGNISLDGTHMKANASIDQNVTYERAQQLRAQLQQDIDQLLSQAEQADQQEDPQSLPEEINRRKKLHAKMDRALDELKQRAARRDQKALAEHEERLAQRKQKEAETGRKPGGPQPKAPATGPEQSPEQCNLTDPDARIMRKNKRSNYTQSYNAQAAVDADGSQLILGQHVSQSASDSAQLEPGLSSLPEELGTPAAVLVDAGYVDAEAIERVEQSGATEVYCSVHREDAHSERRYDYRPPRQSQRPVKKITDPRLLQMKEKLETAEGKALYGLRNQTVEPVFGIIKEVMGIRGFQLRGHKKVSGEWTLICLSYNLKRLDQLQKNQAAGKN